MPGPKPKKRWGQNFLREPNTARKIVAAALSDGPEKHPVIEIGPGTGALTRLLLESDTPYTGIEIDPQLAADLRDQYAGHPHFHLEEKDVLELDWPALLENLAPSKAVVIGNIPYNITSPILFTLFENSTRLHSAVIMMQKEVAERLVALPNTKAYGLLAIFTRIYCDCRYLFKVGAHQFFPVPKVDSAVVKLDFREDPVADFPDFDLFRRVLRHCFQQRRKMLRKSLGSLFPADHLSKLRFDLTRRPENLSLTEWQDLTAQLLATKESSG
ncbi:MAG TPA: 16S rRNA (adenine(1518)-N(6)/adenine(1519)-N(6))-dimethyltransferase RsmA [Calditrichia bacterium]|nr:ribosomal RNA small subunit methyltransferase A [Calditrichota bacterium]HQU71218.1 16S rRNA (adenine(1518)-N(6)/adenine(1519)-N(6))-dimethyltransferase RsmA [Calditrichia bacterium]HQV31722.1 16S rRNA (adenine(1518)-N(6)/adenine(1519)-N(6))-dimethyltransferase RsmA [Calditrichia bacterium]